MLGPSPRQPHTLGETVISSSAIYAVIRCSALCIDVPIGANFWPALRVGDWFKNEILPNPSEEVAMVIEQVAVGCGWVAHGRGDWWSCARSLPGRPARSSPPDPGQRIGTPASVAPPGRARKLLQESVTSHLVIASHVIWWAQPQNRPTEIAGAADGWQAQQGPHYISRHMHPDT